MKGIRLETKLAAIAMYLLSSKKDSTTPQRWEAHCSMDREVQRRESERKEINVISRVAVDETMTMKRSVISSFGHRKE